MDFITSLVVSLLIGFACGFLIGYTYRSDQIIDADHQELDSLHDSKAILRAAMATERQRNEKYPDWYVQADAWLSKRHL
mgnify:FL=1